MQRTYRNRLV